jgi:hypothetical protein
MRTNKDAQHSETGAVDRNHGGGTRKELQTHAGNASGKEAEKFSAFLA